MSQQWNNEARRQPEQKLEDQKTESQRKQETHIRERQEQQPSSPTPPPSQQTSQPFQQHLQQPPTSLSSQQSPGTCEQQPSYTSPDVLVLTETNFDSHINNSGTILITFYAPWCPRSQQLLPILDQLAANLKSQGIKIGKVDATRELNLADRFGILGYPTLILFHDNKMYVYNGPRTLEEITDFVTSGYKKLNGEEIPKPGEKRKMELNTIEPFSFKEVIDMDDLNFDNLIDSDSPWLIAFYTPGSNAEFEKVWDELGRKAMGRFNVGRVNPKENRSLAKRFRLEENLDRPVVKLFKNRKVYDFSGPIWTEEALTFFALEGYMGAHASNIPESVS